MASITKFIQRKITQRLEKKKEVQQTYLFGRVAKAQSKLQNLKLNPEGRQVIMETTRAAFWTDAKLNQILVDEKVVADIEDTLAAVQHKLAQLDEDRKSQEECENHEYIMGIMGRFTKLGWTAIHDVVNSRSVMRHGGLEIRALDKRQDIINCEILLYLLEQDRKRFQQLANDAIKKAEGEIGQNKAQTIADNIIRGESLARLKGEAPTGLE